MNTKLGNTRLHAAAARTADGAEQAALEAERLKIQAEQKLVAAAEDDARSQATYQEAATVDPDMDTAEHGGINPEADRAGVPTGRPVKGLIHNAGNASEGGPATGDSAQSAQENLHGRRKDAL